MKITCPHCDGSGLMELPRHLRDTLEWLRQHPRASAHLLRDALMPEAGVTGANNRLRVLEELGFACRVGKDERTVLWSVSP